MLRLLRWAAVLLALGLAAGVASAQIGAVNGYCNLGATPAKTQGLNSTNTLQGIISSCTVTVYATGTSNKATLYSNVTLTPLSNPFTASTVGKFIFFASTTACYDITLSGGTAPNSYPAPVTITDVCLTNGGGGGGAGTVTSVSVANILQGNTVPFINADVIDPTTNALVVQTLATEQGGEYLAGPCGLGSLSSIPNFRLICAADLPIMGASGALTHAPGAVPDPGTTAGTSKFLREDATFAIPVLGGSCPAITFSATPTYDFSSATCRTITLSSAITSSSTTGYTVGVVYQVVWIENGTGNFPQVPPTQFQGGPTTIRLAANGRTQCSYLANPDGNLYLQGCSWF